jgi:hypothetical protein
MTVRIMEYKITVKIEALDDIASIEDPPETFEGVFECENKDMGVSIIFEALSRNWNQLKRESKG